MLICLQGRGAPEIDLLEVMAGVENLKAQGTKLRLFIPLLFPCSSAHPLSVRPGHPYKQAVPLVFSADLPRGD